ncbi:unnamed protein product [Lactuca virosa]|uniref:Uncharacterized protein n=1 Tax=Lactuca virosa TaxID=75947 RepID=A0AAU9PR47_9ASTR|nr:unnamed protein product [Lactuca virosa]
MLKKSFCFNYRWNWKIFVIVIELQQDEKVEIYQPLCEMMEGIISWIRGKKNSLGKHSFQHNASCWTGDKALKELEEASISKQCFPSLQECATKVLFS